MTAAGASRATVVLAALAALALPLAPAGAQTDYVGLPPAPAPVPQLVQLPGDAGVTDPYVGVSEAYVGVPAALVQVGETYAGVGPGSPYAGPPPVAVAAAPPAGVGATDAAFRSAGSGGRTDLASPSATDPLPPLVTGRDYAALALMGVGALVGFAVLVGRRRSH